jgi:hypothetical protein
VAAPKEVVAADLARMGGDDEKSLGGFAALHESVPGTFRTSGNVRLESANWAKAGIDQVAHHQLRFHEYTPLQRGVGQARM